MNREFERLFRNSLLEVIENYIFILINEDCNDSQKRYILRHILSFIKICNEEEDAIQRREHITITNK